jgi:signal transduction histidine kinase
MRKNRIDEFHLLNETLQRMLTTNTQTFEHQKQFIENASHELQTPLAISINKLETLAESRNLSPVQLQLLSSALDSLERLTRLNKSLLLLSRIENKQFHETEPVRIDEIAKKILEDFSDQLSYSQVTAELDIQSACIQTMNRDLAMVLVTNLVKNSIIHNHPGGFLKLLVTADSLEIQNSGVERSLDQEKLFSRFYKEATGTSTGLGLAIVKSIGSLYKFNITYSYQGSHLVRVEFN